MNSCSSYFTIRLNRSRKTYTIRHYFNGVLVCKYRSLPQGINFCEDWTEKDIKNFLLSHNDYYLVNS